MQRPNHGLALILLWPGLTSIPVAAYDCNVLELKPRWRRDDARLRRARAAGQSGWSGLLSSDTVLADSTTTSSDPDWFFPSFTLERACSGNGGAQAGSGLDEARAAAATELLGWEEALSKNEEGASEKALEGRKAGGTCRADGSARGEATPGLDSPSAAEAEATPTTERANKVAIEERASPPAPKTTRNGMGGVPLSARTSGRTWQPTPRSATAAPHLVLCRAAFALLRVLYALARPRGRRPRG
eukprot:scaffold1206_cov388-Prasinococcus_capsulatus_cf.AAC.10